MTFLLMIPLAVVASAAYSADVPVMGQVLRQQAPYSANYGVRIAAAIRPHIDWSEKEPLPHARCEVMLALDEQGKVLGRHVVDTSGSSAWCATVLRAIDSAERVPKDTDGRVPPRMAIGFNSKD